MKEEILVLKSQEELLLLEEYIEDKEYIAFDVETNGTKHDSKVIGFSICADSSLGIYVILSYFDTTAQTLIDLNIDPTSFLTKLKQKNLIMHNGIFDSKIIYNNYRISLIESLHTDTLILAHLLDENRKVGLKDLGAQFFGQDAIKEQKEMKESVADNGGKTSKTNFEMYKADPELLAKYGAKDSILTLNLFYLFVEELYNKGLDSFFYKDESMPLFRGPTYDLNTRGLKVDIDRLIKLKGELEAENMELTSAIYTEIAPYIKDKYSCTNKKNTFNLNSNVQIAWLLFGVLKNPFHLLTEAGKKFCQQLSIKIPYTYAQKKAFIELCESSGVPNFWKYCSTNEDTLEKYKEYKWVERLLKYKENTKILNTYVMGILERVSYGVVRPRFIQNGTTSGRYSSKDPNFQNLPRDDKRIKSCIISRPGMVFVGADYSQLEPRVFASISGDPKLIASFEKGEDFYSVVGIPIFEKYECSAVKSDENSFAKKYPELRNIAKAFALATPYGTGAYQQSRALKRPVDECQMIIERYFESYPKVELMMLESHEMAKQNGIVYSLYGRPRRILEAKEITELYGTVSHENLPYQARTLLNLGMNHRVQSSAASIVNRAAILFTNKVKELGLNAYIVMQVHDELIVECDQKIANEINKLLKYCMENATILPNVKLIADPKIANNLADLK